MKAEDYENRFRLCQIVFLVVYFFNIYYLSIVNLNVVINIFSPLKDSVLEIYMVFTGQIKKNNVN